MSLKKLGRYDIIKPLGKGAMGFVYEAHDPNIKRAVAIKTIRVDQLTDEMAAEYESRFRSETQAGGRLQHPNIIGVYDAGRDQGMAFIVMELVRGGDLRQLLEQGRRLPIDRSMVIIRELLSALSFAHEQGIIHRDVKPANVMLDPNGRVKLGDFGVARISDGGEATRTQGSMVGTLKYMSPEQVIGAKVDARTDIFAAGVVLYQLLTGTKPFEGDSDFAIMQAITQKDPPRPSTLNPGLPEGMDAVVFKALAKNRDDRFASAKDFALGLRGIARPAGGISPPPAPPVAAEPVPRVPESGAGATTSTGTGSQSTGSTATSAVSQEMELLYWKDIQNSADAEDFQEFLRQFPGGVYAALAQRKLRKLEDVMTDRTGSQSMAGPVDPPATPPAADDGNTRLDPWTTPGVSQSNAPVGLVVRPVAESCVQLKVIESFVETGEESTPQQESKARKAEKDRKAREAEAALKAKEAADAHRALERQKKAEAQKAQEDRQAEQQRAERVAEELRRAKEAEDARKAEEAREQAELAEAARRIEEEKNAERIRHAEKEREESKARQAEEQRLAREAEVARKAEEARKQAELAEKARRIEEAKAAERIRQADKEREESKARQAEEQRREKEAEVARKAEEARKQAELAEKARRIEEEKSAERIRQAEQERAAREAEKQRRDKEAEDAPKAKEAPKSVEAKTAPLQQDGGPTLVRPGAKPPAAAGAQPIAQPASRPPREAPKGDESEQRSRGRLIAIAVSVAVLGGGGAWFALQKDDKKPVEVAPAPGPAIDTQNSAPAPQPPASAPSPGPTPSLPEPSPAVPDPPATPATPPEAGSKLEAALKAKEAADAQRALEKQKKDEAEKAQKARQAEQQRAEREAEDARKAEEARKQAELAEAARRIEEEKKAERERAALEADKLRREKEAEDARKAEETRKQAEPTPPAPPPKATPAELYEQGQKLESTSVRQAEAKYRQAAQQGHGPSQKRLWELLSKSPGREAEALRFQREAWNQKVPGVPEPKSALRL